MAGFHFLSFSNNNPQVFANSNTNMTHNITVINTSLPPPNFRPAIQMQCAPPPVHTSSIPPGPLHVNTTDVPMQNATTNPPPQFNPVSLNYLRTPPPPVAPAFTPNSQSGNQWNNQTYENKVPVNPTFPSTSYNPGCNRQSQLNNNVNFNSPMNQTLVNNQHSIQSSNYPVTDPSPNSNLLENTPSWLKFKNNNEARTNFIQIHHVNNCSLNNKTMTEFRDSINWDTRKLLITNVLNSTVFEHPSTVFGMNNKSEDEKKISYSNKLDNRYFSNNVNSTSSYNSEPQNVNGNNFDNQCNNNNYNKRKNPFIDLCSSPKKFHDNKFKEKDYSQYRDNQFRKFNKKFDNDNFKSNWNKTYEKKNFNSDHVSNSRNKSSIHNNLIDIQVLSSDESNYEAEIQVESLESFRSTSNRKSWNSDVMTHSDSDSVEYIDRSKNSSISEDVYQRKNVFQNKVWNIREDTFEPKSDWMTDKIKFDLQRRNALFAKFRNSDDPELWKEYNTLKNQINEDIKNAKANCGNSFKRVNNGFQKPYMKQNEYKQKEKDLPFSGDVCNRGFPSDSEYKKHSALHVKDWMTDKIKFDLQRRNALFVKIRNSDDPELWKEYNTLKNQINEDIKNAKANCGNSFKRVNKSFQKSYMKRNEYKQKEKDLPFSCDMCDRGFLTDSEYKEHCALHVKCDYAGCNFEAHPKVVALHQKMQHDTGYADAINKLQNDEEIKKWREERRKRFPTAENILKRKAEQAEREERGEVIETKDFGQFKKRKFDKNKLHQPRRRHRNRAARQPRNYLDRGFDSEDSEEDDCHIKLLRFKGINYKLNEEEKNSDNEATIEISASRDPIDQQDSKNSDDEAPCEIPISREPINQPKTDDQKDQTNFDAEAHCEIPISREYTNQSKIDDQKDQTNKNNYKRRKNNREPAPSNRSISFLEMLLDDEIRHERNVVLQSIRYIVQNDFFGIGTDIKE